MSYVSMAEYKFECDEELLRYLNMVEAKLDMTHREFVEQAAKFADANPDEFEEFEEQRDERRRRNR